VALRYFALWMRACDEFRAWERREIYLKEPDASALSAYRDDLKWMLRAGRMIHALAADPDFPESDLPRELHWRLAQLEESWKTLNSPMTDAEADALIATYFPHEPRP
jgi:hypothetical protein